MNYTCYRGTVDIDGDLDKAAWASAPQTPRFALPVKAPTTHWR